MYFLSKKKKIGLFFGSFNPVHLGHLIVANYIHNIELVDEVWFVVSPQSPFKDSSELLSVGDRLEILEKSILHVPYFRVCDIELHLPIPSFTINTLEAIKDQYEDINFSLIMGADNVKGFKEWLRWESIEQLVDAILVYSRNGKVSTFSKENLSSKMIVLDSPIIEISSTHIRRLILEAKSIRYLVPQNTEDLIKHKYQLGFE